MIQRRHALVAATLLSTVAAFSFYHYILRTLPDNDALPATQSSLTPSELADEEGRPSRGHIDAQHRLQDEELSTKWKKSRFQGLSDVVLILNYNHPTDAFKSLSFWSQLYSGVFLDVVPVSTEAIPELGIESALPRFCNRSVVTCVRQSCGSSSLPKPLGLRPPDAASSATTQTQALARRMLHTKSVMASEVRQREMNATSSDAGNPESDAGEGSGEERGQDESTGLPAGRETPPWLGECHGEACNCSDTERLFWSAVEACREQQEKQQRPRGPFCNSAAYFVYASLVDILPRYPDAAGFLWTNDDVILNYWNLAERDKSKIWFRHPSVNSDDSSNTSTEVQHWVTVPTNSSSTQKMIGRWEFKRASIARAVSALHSLPQSYREQYKVSLLPDVDVVLKDVADVYYIPRAYVSRVLEIVPLFLDARVRSEMAIPMMLCALESPKEFDSIALQDIVYVPPARVVRHERRAVPGYTKSISAFHPWKMRSPSEASRILDVLVQGDGTLQRIRSDPMFAPERHCFFSLK